MLKAVVNEISLHIGNLKLKIAVNTHVLYFISTIMVYTQQIKMEGIKLWFLKCSTE